MHRRELLSCLLPLLVLAATTRAQYVDTTRAAAKPVLSHRIALVSTFFMPRNPLWRGDSLTCEARSFGAPLIGGEYMFHRTPSWLLGVNVSTTRVYTDAIHARSTSIGSNTEWTVHGERMGLDQRFTCVGAIAAYEPWHFPRRHKVGMTVQLGGGLQYMHFSERRYVIDPGSAEAQNYSGHTVYTYDTPDNIVVLGRSDGHGLSATVWLRPELHFGRRVSLYWDFGAVFATPFQADGSVYTTTRGSMLSIAPRDVQLERFLVRTGLAVHF